MPQQKVDVNRNPDEGGDCKCDKEQFPNVCIILSIIGLVLIIVVAILNLMNFEDGVPGVMLDLYLVVLALFGMAAEFRKFKAVRGTIYIVMKYTYFLTSYYSRSLFYIFLGSLVLDTKKPLMLITAIYMMTVGVVYALLHFIYKFPKYLDWQVVKAEQEEKLRREVEKKFNTASAAATPVAAAAVDIAPPPVPAPGKEFNANQNIGGTTSSSNNKPSSPTSSSAYGTGSSGSGGGAYGTGTNSNPNSKKTASYTANPYDNPYDPPAI